YEYLNGGEKSTAWLDVALFQPWPSQNEV
ncbi:MAG: hypothetical protein AVDCRST_MAG93-3997, partial [uncultured Chloroflexia bacterium]